MNPADIVVIAVILLSGLMAFFRGFVREGLSIAGWVGAVYVAILGLPHARPYVEQHIDNETAASVVAGAGIFIIALIAFGLIGSLIAKLVRGTTLSAVDRSLGFLFGLVRGVVLVSLAYLIMAQVFPEGQEPEWFEQAHSRPWVERSSGILVSLVPEDVMADALGAVRARTAGGEDGEEGGSGTLDLRGLSRPQPAAPESPGDEGYQDDQTGDLDRMIESLQERQ